jgi:hypothetical protein
MSTASWAQRVVGVVFFTPGVEAKARGALRHPVVVDQKDGTAVAQPVVFHRQRLHFNARAAQGAGPRQQRGVGRDDAALVLGDGARQQPKSLAHGLVVRAPQFLAVFKYRPAQPGGRLGFPFGGHAVALAGGIKGFVGHTVVVKSQHHHCKLKQNNKKATFFALIYLYGSYIKHPPALAQAVDWF